MDLMFEPLRRYADFEGRARRSEYWLFCLMTTTLTVLFFLPVFFAGARPQQPEMAQAALVSMLVLVLITFGLFIPSMAVLVRRLHDTGRSGWWVLINLLPFGGAVLFIFTVLDGEDGANRFGPDPKDRDFAGVFA
jgi:uncharacterized membrane protein YhaH (DUF805 family)